MLLSVKLKSVPVLNFVLDNFQVLIHLTGNFEVISFICMLISFALLVFESLYRLNCFLVQGFRREGNPFDYLEVHFRGL